jgi:hypothetical protein
LARAQLSLAYHNTSFITVLYSLIFVCPCITLEGCYTGIT